MIGISILILVALLHGVQSLQVPRNFALKPTKTKHNSKVILEAIRGPIRYASNDWFDCLLTLPSSRILKRTKSSIFFNTLWTTILVLVYKFLNVKFTFPAVVHSILGSTLSLLLVFRTNSSYDRFWEARKLWSNLVSVNRDLARLTYLHIDKSYHERIAKLIVAFTVVLKQHLQGDTIDVELVPFLPAPEITKIQTLRNRPIFILRELSTAIHDALKKGATGGGMDSNDRVISAKHAHQFDDCIHSLTAVTSSCERIVKTPVPLSYSRHTSRFLFLFMYSLPLVLIPTLGWLTLPTMLATFWSITSIQEIGHFIEEPFNKDLELLSLGHFITVVRADLSEQLDGVVASPEFEKFDEELLKNAKRRSRLRDDTYFAFY